MSENAVFTPEQLWMSAFVANPYPTYNIPFPIWMMP
jgi:hypothetical protein